MGLAMGATAVALIYSPWGRRSGAHMNPATTLAFWRLGRIEGRDVLGYIFGQFIGGVLGVGVAALLLSTLLSHPSVSYAATHPGIYGIRAAWWAEFLIAFLLISTVLIVMNGSWAKHTGLFAGALVALYIAVEAPISGMSMNPARSFASNAFAMNWSSMWIYFTAPTLGMMLASSLYKTLEPIRCCAKLVHWTQDYCMFCQGRPQ